MKTPILRYEGYMETLSIKITTNGSARIGVRIIAGRVWFNMSTTGYMYEHADLFDGEDGQLVKDINNDSVCARITSLMLVTDPNFTEFDLDIASVAISDAVDKVINLNKDSDFIDTVMVDYFNANVIVECMPKENRSMLFSDRVIMDTTLPIDHSKELAHIFSPIITSKVIRTCVEKKATITEAMNITKEVINAGYRGQGLITILTYDRDIARKFYMHIFYAINIGIEHKPVPSSEYGQNLILETKYDKLWGENDEE